MKLETQRRIEVVVYRDIAEKIHEIVDLSGSEEVLIHIKDRVFLSVLKPSISTVILSELRTLVGRRDGFGIRTV